MLERPRRPLGWQPFRELRRARESGEYIDQRRRDQPFGMIGAPRLLGRFQVGRLQASAALTAATASFAAPPSGPPPCAMSGRPPPPCPPSAAPAALTRSKIGRASCRESVSVRVDLGGRRIIKKNKRHNTNIMLQTVTIDYTTIYRPSKLKLETLSVV